MLIKTEYLPTKNIINFYVPEPLTTENSPLLFFNDETMCDDFLREIFGMPEIKRCLIAEKLLSVQFAENAEKEDIKAFVLACLDDYISNSKYFIDVDDAADLLTKCDALTDALIRPTLNRDGGDIVLVSLSDDILEVQFIGHCAGCPYAQNTLQNVIMRTLKHYFPQIKEVKLKE